MLPEHWVAFLFLAWYLHKSGKITKFAKRNEEARSNNVFPDAHATGMGAETR